jgi:hypothetical protein
MRRALLAYAFVLSALLAGCGPSLPSDTPGIEGVVASVEAAAGDGTFTVLVEVPEGVDPTGFVSDKASVRITPETLIFSPGGSSGDASLIASGVGIRVWFEGPVAESYPVQGTAGAIQAAP